ncbi:histidine--tRNA ligase [Fluviispira multicolorata]|uniref:Histidine--tRNA ligase n=1 Tax=Fluviispira multicolorata TaxID=2654512 RepID=A0A833N7N8_9BACT|nr:histidine--tRNA ligase [Fluviispira multicolorata]KAB8033176.1 histidine--tRNA ligase [Fluviispira multicolorata]
MVNDNQKIKKTNLSTQGYRGTRDFYPEDQRLKNYVYTKIHTVLKSFGYEEYNGPIVEHLELYAAKSSEEIVREQLYSFKDKGDRVLAIRPEMTPTLARMVAAKQRELPRPIRWYSIPTCMRFERPQRGRLREFDQLNVDIFGGNPLDEDIEIILTAIEVLKSVGATLEQFEVKVNHRGIINSFLSLNIKAPKELIPQILRLLDKKEKMSSEAFQTECKKIELNEKQINQLEKFIHSSIEDIIIILGENGNDAIELKKRIDILNELTQSNCVKFSPEIMRGFDYYTGMVFEVFDKHPENNRSLFGGGRYDNLVGAFGTEELPGIGYGMGDVAILNFMESNNLTPKLKKETDVCVIRFSENDRLEALKITSNLRSLGIKVEAPVVVSKFGKQIQSAEKSGAKAVVFRGNEELQNNLFAVKWLATAEQETFPNKADGYLNFFEKLKNS